LSPVEEKLCQEQKRLEQDLINPDLSVVMKKLFKMVESMVGIGNKFKTLKHFVDGYYNQSVDDQGLNMIKEFRDAEPKNSVGVVRW
jgi:hypothetical protein